MDFKKKLKIRLYTNLIYLLLGTLFIGLFLSGVSENTFLFTLGFALDVIALLGLLRHARITKDEAATRRQEIAEGDERNIAIINRAKSTAFGLYALGAATVTIALELSGRSMMATAVALNLCALVILYRACWWFYRRRI